MTGVNVDLKRLKSFKEDVLQTYLDVFEDTPLSNMQHADLVIRQITSLLSDKSTRLLGMRCLQKVLNQFTAEMLEPKAMLWTSLILKDLSSHEFPANVDIGFAVIGMIATGMKQSSDLSKSFGSNYIGSILETCSKVSSQNYLSSLRCLEICLRLYPEYSGPHKELVQKYVSNFMDMTNKKLTIQSGKCTLLLQQVRARNVNNFNLKTQWKNYQLNLLKSLQVVINLINPSNLNVGAIYLDEESFAPKLKLSAEPIQRSIEIFTRFSNLANYFVIALSEPYPTEKPVMVKKVFDLIDAGLVTGFKVLQNNAMSENFLKILLPEIFLKLIQVLESLIKILQGHLKVYYHKVFEIFSSILKVTSNEKETLNCERFKSVRVKIYNVISGWCSMFGNGSRCEVIAHTVIENIFKDVIPMQFETLIKVTSSSSKAKNTQQHKQNNDNLNTKKGHIELCISALRCLEQILFSSSNFLELDTFKAVQLHILNTCAKFYELPFKHNNVYSNWTCRYEMCNVLKTMFVMAHPLYPPPTEMVFHILKNAFIKDDSQKVRNYCGEILMNFERIVHPQKESLAFTDVGDRNSKLILHNEFVSARADNINTKSYFHKSTMTESNNDLESDFLNNEANTTSFETNSDIQKLTTRENNIDLTSDALNNDEDKNMTLNKLNAVKDFSIESNQGEIPNVNTNEVENLDQTVQNISFIPVQTRKIDSPNNDTKRIKLQSNDTSISKDTFNTIIEDDNCSLDSIEAAFVDELN
ncbi:uncharacterized protein LOC119677425 [Teleopsis dalmanni]|uniref:uncharacterized protein LOC119677425 n=1 Tax=Teleopsis dalmanni TaxID=139649 RepID=UPI0018CE686B|nr:uncharacterized protein LOC119677425 [Teleopsis dalmanni]